MPVNQGALLGCSTTQQPRKRLYDREEWAEGFPEPGALLLGLLRTSQGGGGGGGGGGGARGSEEIPAFVGVDVQRQKVVRLLVFPRQLPLVVGGSDAALGVTAYAPLKDQEHGDDAYNYPYKYLYNSCDTMYFINLKYILVYQLKGISDVDTKRFKHRVNFLRI